MTASAAEAVIHLLRDHGRTVATAESLTGGLLCGALTDVPGASHVVRGGVVSYATDVKSALLGVDEALLGREGAVHPDVARQMALGVCRSLGADVGVATTGVAGPDPADGRPVGTVYVAVAVGDAVTVRSLALSGDRAGIRAATVDAAIALLGEALE
jgi:nicotinamide-nucleotide amidase